MVNHLIAEVFCLEVNFSLTSFPGLPRFLFFILH